MGGAPEVGAALLRVLQHGYTEHWTMNNHYLVSGVSHKYLISFSAGIEMFRTWAKSKSRTYTTKGNWKWRQLRHRFCSLAFSERRQLKKIYKHLYCICSNDWAFLLICSFIDRLVNIITIKIAKWIVKILFILNI